MYSNGVRKVSYQFDVLRNGVEVTQLFADEGSPASVTMVADAEIKTYMRGAFKINNAVNPLTDRIRPVLVLDGVPYPLGEYIISVLNRQHTSTSSTMTIEAYDQTLALAQNRLDGRQTFKAGEAYLNVIERLMIECGLTRVIADHSSEVLATTREDWEIGTTYLTIVNQLLSEINYGPIWIDAFGIARLQKRTLPNGDNIQHTYRADSASIITAQTSSTLDIYNAPNVFIAEVSNPDYAQPLRAIAVNDDPTSVLSTVNRGRRIVAPVERLDNIASQAELQEYVDQVCSRSMLSTETVTFQTAAEPGHGVGDIVALDHPTLSGAYQEMEWEITLAPGAYMRHKARRIEYI